MKQTITQTFLLTAILCVVILYAIYGLVNMSRSEGYSPYRGTGGCPYKTGMNYLDVYTQEDYYRKHPYVYPTPNTYVTELYAKRRKQSEIRKLKALAMLNR